MIIPHSQRSTKNEGLETVQSVKLRRQARLWWSDLLQLTIQRLWFPVGLILVSDHARIHGSVVDRRRSEVVLHVLLPQKYFSRKNIEGTKQRIHGFNFSEHKILKTERKRECLFFEFVRIWFGKKNEGVLVYIYREREGNEGFEKSLLCWLRYVASKKRNLDTAS